MFLSHTLSPTLLIRFSRSLFHPLFLSLHYVSTCHSSMYKANNWNNFYHWINWFHRINVFLILGVHTTLCFLLALAPWVAQLQIGLYVGSNTFWRDISKIFHGLGSARCQLKLWCWSRFVAWLIFYPSNKPNHKNNVQTFFYFLFEWNSKSFEVLGSLIWRLFGWWSAIHTIMSYFTWTGKMKFTTLVASRVRQTRCLGSLGLTLTNRCTVWQAAGETGRKRCSQTFLLYLEYEDNSNLQHCRPWSA